MTEPLKEELLSRLRARIQPAPNYLFANAVGGMGCAAAPAVVVSGTTVVGGPDKDIQEAVAEIERLSAEVSRLSKGTRRPPYHFETVKRDDGWYTFLCGKYGPGTLDMQVSDAFDSESEAEAHGRLIRELVEGDAP